MFAHPGEICNDFIGRGQCKEMAIEWVRCLRAQSCLNDDLLRLRVSGHTIPKATGRMTVGVEPRAGKAFRDTGTGNEVVKKNKRSYIQLCDIRHRRSDAERYTRKRRDPCALRNHIPKEPNGPKIHHALEPSSTHPSSVTTISLQRRSALLAVILGVIADSLKKWR